MIPLKIIYESGLVRIGINHEKKFLHAIWLQHPNREEFKTENLIIADSILTNEAKKVLFDVRKRYYQNIDDQTIDQSWLETKILPLFQNYKQFRCAYLVTQESFESMYNNQLHGLILDRTELFKHMEVGVFLEVQEAQDWLLNG